MKRLQILLGLIVVGCISQAKAGAQDSKSKAFEEKWQVGAAFALVNPDYTNSAIPGVTVYGDYNAMKYLGVDARLHFANKSGGERETSVTGGYRFMLPIKGRFEPFAGGLIGFGHFSDGFPNAVGNGNNSFVISYLGGVDVRVAKHLNVRGEIESQSWTDFTPNGLIPVAYSFGVAYHR